MYDLNKESPDFSTPAPNLDASALAERLQQLPAWEIITRRGQQQLQATFAFKKYRQAMGFCQLVAELAESVQHHPEIVLAWGQVTINWWTHSTKGIQHNDFIMAAKTGKLFEAQQSD